MGSRASFPNRAGFPAQGHTVPKHTSFPHARSFPLPAPTNHARNRYLGHGRDQVRTTGPRDRKALREPHGRGRPRTQETVRLHTNLTGGAAPQTQEIVGTVGLNTSLTGGASPQTHVGLHTSLTGGAAPQTLKDRKAPHGPHRRGHSPDSRGSRAPHEPHRRGRSPDRSSRPWKDHSKRHRSQDSHSSRHSSHYREKKHPRHRSRSRSLPSNSPPLPINSSILQYPSILPSSKETNQSQFTVARNQEAVNSSKILRNVRTCLTRNQSLVVYRIAH